MLAPSRLPWQRCDVGGMVKGGNYHQPAMGGTGLDSILTESEPEN